MEKLLKLLVKDKSILSECVYESMNKVDRADFTSSCPYEDSPQYLGFGATISAPHMHAYALEYLKDFLRPNGKVLDVGYGSGYLCAAFSSMMNHTGLVVGIEHINELCEMGKNNLMKNHSNLIEEKKIILLESDGRQGYPEFGPYDCIHVGAAAEIIPETLIDQLNLNGRMMIPVGNQNESQFIYLVDKDSQGKVTLNKLIGVRYIPLTSKTHQLKYI